MEKEEYELVPLNPIRRLEKKVEELETVSKVRRSGEEIIDILKTNQEIVDDLVKANSDLIKRVSDLTVSMDALSRKITDMLDRIDISAETEHSEETNTQVEEELENRLKKIEKKVNALLISKIPAEKWQEIKKRHTVGQA